LPEQAVFVRTGAIPQVKEKARIISFIKALRGMAKPVAAIPAASNSSRLSAIQLLRYA
jgi:hypothetical protein